MVPSLDDVEVEMWVRAIPHWQLGRQMCIQDQVGSRPTTKDSQLSSDELLVMLGCINDLVASKSQTLSRLRSHLREARYIDIGVARGTTRQTVRRRSEARRLRISEKAEGG